MGLDIYVIKTRDQFDYELTKENYNRIADDANNMSKGFLTRDYAECIRRLTEASKESKEKYAEVHKECVNMLKKHFSYPQFDLNPLGYSTKWERVDPDDESKGYEDKEYFETVPVETWVLSAKNIIESHYAPSVAYFRKVNFIFAYFENKGTLIDEYFAPVRKEDCLDIIDRCKKVLENHDLADELLPTRAGFFFGNTSYDEYYYDNVKHVLEQFTEKVLPVFDEPAWEKGEVSEQYENEKMNCFIEFSW